MHRLWVNAERTVLVRFWLSGEHVGECEMATRESPEHTWGPPIQLQEEQVA